MIMWLLVLIFHCRALKSLQYTCPLLTNNTNMVSLKGIVNVICLLRMQKLTFYFILFFFYVHVAEIRCKIICVHKQCRSMKEKVLLHPGETWKIMNYTSFWFVDQVLKKKKTAVQHKKLLFFYRWQYILMCQLLAKFYGLLILCQFQEFGCLYT